MNIIWARLIKTLHHIVGIVFITRLKLYVIVEDIETFQNIYIYSFIQFYTV